MDTVPGRVGTMRLDTYALILAFVVLIGMTSLAYGEEAEAAVSDVGRVYGWAIGCKCLKHNEATVMTFVEDIFPHIYSDSELKKMKSYITWGVTETGLYDNSDQICSRLCYGAGRRELLEQLDAAIDRWKQTSGQPQ